MEKYCLGIKDKEESYEMMREREKRKKRKKTLILYSHHGSTCSDNIDTG